MDYLETQVQEIKHWNITIVEDSKCWNRMHAHCDGSRKICKWIRKQSYRSLFSLLHEIGHIETDVKGMKRCEQESEATRWAVERLRTLGIPIKRKILRDYKDYTKKTYERGVRRGLKKQVKSKLYL